MRSCGDLQLCLNDGSLKSRICGDFENHDWLFGKHVENRGLFFKYVEAVPLALLLLEEGVLVQNVLKTDPYVQNIWKICNSIVFKSDTNPLSSKNHQVSNHATFHGRTATKILYVFLSPWPATQTRSIHP